MTASNDDRRHHHNCIERVGERHQRRGQKRRYSLDELEPNEPRQNKNIKIRNKIRWHYSSFKYFAGCPVNHSVPRLCLVVCARQGGDFEFLFDDHCPHVTPLLGCPILACFWLGWGS